MGSDTAQILEALPCVKVHRFMCAQLKKIVDRVSQIFPAIESARPRCRSGIEVLCSLNLAIEKAKLLIEHCTESSKLYLAITGEAITLRCERVQNALGQSLYEIQNMVPLQLAEQISAVLAVLKDTKFSMESYEAETGKVLLRLLRQSSDSTEASELEAFQIAALRLHITTSKALLIEKRSVKKLLDKVQDTDPRKERILKYLLYLLRKYGQSIGGDQIVNANGQCEVVHLSANSACINVATDHSIQPEPRVGYSMQDVKTDVVSKHMPPDEFKCPISQRIMQDPVVIASGQTFERMWIEKWFSEGHDTCPRTEQKLSHLSVTPNSAMKDLISKWCKKHEISIPDPCSQQIPAEVYSWRINYSNSVASFGSSLNDVAIRNYDSSKSFGSDVNGSSISIQTDNNYCSCQSSLNISGWRNSDSLCEVNGFPWESQCKLMEDIKSHLKDNEQASHSILSPSFIQLLIRYLKDACDRCDINAQRVGAQLLLIFVIKSRNEVPSFYEDVFLLSVSFLDSEIIEEALQIMQVLSGDQCFKSKFLTSGVVPSILKVLDSQIKELQVSAFKVLCNLSSLTNTLSQHLYLGYIPKLVSFLGDKALAGHCLTILNDVCNTKEGRIAVVEANECIASVAEVLEVGSHDEQEHAVGILLSLCSHCFEHCPLVMQEGVIPSLVNISINGSTGGKEKAMELLRLLRDLTYTNNSQEHSRAPEESSLELPCDPAKCSVKVQSASKTRFFGRKIKLFSKPRSLALF